MMVMKGYDGYAVPGGTKKTMTLQFGKEEDEGSIKS